MLFMQSVLSPVLTLAEVGEKFVLSVNLEDSWTQLYEVYPIICFLQHIVLHLYSGRHPNKPLQRTIVNSDDVG